MEKKIKNIAFLGTDFFYDCIPEMERNGYKIKWIFTFECDNKYAFNIRVVDFARNNNIPITYRKITKADIEQLSSDGCDLIVSAAYKFKLPIIPEMPKAINIHPTLLPYGRGPWPIPQVILKNLQTTGVTFHKINSEFDKGDILYQHAFEVFETDNLETLSCRYQIMAKNMIASLLDNFDELYSNAKPQVGGDYWSMPTIEERTIDWNTSIFEIEKIVRAFGKFDSFAIFDNKEWIVQDVKSWLETHSHSPGEVVHRTDREVVVSAKDGFVCIRYYSIDPDFVN